MTIQYMTTDMCIYQEMRQCEIEGPSQYTLSQSCLHCFSMGWETCILICKSIEESWFSSQMSFVLHLLDATMLYMVARGCVSWRAGDSETVIAKGDANQGLAQF